MSTDLKLLSEALASAFLDGEWRLPALIERGAAAIGRPNKKNKWLVKAAERALVQFTGRAPRESFDDLAAWLARDPDVSVVAARSPELPLRFIAPRSSAGIVAMNRDAHPSWQRLLPTLDTTRDVASWLGLSIEDLAWFADVKGFARRSSRAPKLAHYTYRWLPKRSPVGGMRLVEAPKRWLKDLQRRILFEILDRIPPHDAAHGFRSGRSILTHTRVHAGKALVLRMDLEDFFVSITAPRILRIFRAAGYPQEVASLLTGLCTTRAPLHPPEQAAHLTHRARMRYRARHLPQGAPTSPALANLAAFGLDVRLTAAAAKADAIYTRYADDLVFSSCAESGSTFAEGLRAHRFSSLTSAIAIEELFEVNHRKTRIMRAGRRQVVTGLVLNQSPAIAREEYDRLKAILHNCVARGPENENRNGHPDLRSHLEGKVAWLTSVQAKRGAKLKLLLDRIAW